MDKNEDADIIEIPIKINESSQITKHEDTYVLKISNSLDSKRVIASKTPSKDVYFLLEISESVNIIAKTKNLYHFADPVDFILPGNSAFYENFILNLLDNDEDFDMPRVFPPHYPTVTIRPPIFPFPRFKLGCSSASRVHVEKVKYDDKVPTEVPQKYVEYLAFNLDKLPRITIANEKADNSQPQNPPKTKNLEILKSREIIDKIAKDWQLKENRKIISDEITKILKILFDERPIYRYVELKEKLEDLLDFTYLSHYRVKMHIPMVAYFCISGPWKNQWIRYGYDPKKHMSAYIYQRLPIRIQKRGFVIHYSKEILEIIRNNAEIYLKDRCDYNLGYFTKEFIDFMQNYLKDPVHLDSIRFDDEFEEEYYEVYE